MSWAADQRARLLAKRDASGANGDAGGDQSCFPNHPPTFRMSDFAHHGPGSIEVPSLRNSTYKNRLFRADSDRRRGLRGSVAHARHRLARQYELPHVHIDSTHAGQDHIIAAAGVNDQELSITSIRPGKGDPSVAGRNDDTIFPRGDGKAFFGPAIAVGRAKAAQRRAGRRQWQAAFKIFESDRRREARRIAERRRQRLGPLLARQGGVRGLAGRVGVARRLRRASRGLAFALHAGDQILDARRLSRQPRGYVRPARLARFAFPEAPPAAPRSSEPASRVGTRAPPFRAPVWLAASGCRRAARANASDRPAARPFPPAFAGAPRRSPWMCGSPPEYPRAAPTAPAAVGGPCVATP